LNLTKARWWRRRRRSVVIFFLLVLKHKTIPHDLNFKKM